ncbi:uncharacterized protein QC763_207565 [Podospora pseudopauciseta]|uniref:Hydrophobin n=1 Tax=Podospora pseudopauciseta TaxID=2093780 RepID=A0ABR0HQE0_9PEZI|nr:hypothetical protein QC763_207565 [Podospora pseudopauciseta]
MKMQFSKIFLPLAVATTGLAAPAQVDTAPVLVDRQVTLPPVDVNTCVNSLVGIPLFQALCLLGAIPTLNLSNIAACLGRVTNIAPLCGCVELLPALGPVLGSFC